MGVHFFEIFSKKTKEIDEYENVIQLKEKQIEDLSKDAEWLRRLLSHNFRMPMAIIAGYGELLKNDSFSTREEEKECIEKICRNIDYLDTLSKVVLDSNNNNLLEEKEAFDILLCIKEAAEYVKILAQKAGIKIKVNSSKNGVMLTGNRIVLMRAFFNLFENSIKYMKRSGNIVITVEEMDTEVLIVYRDDGEGMESKEVEYITDLSYQGSNRKESGNGIGMYLVKNAITQNGGELTIKSEKGQGITLYMRFTKNL